MHNTTDPGYNSTKKNLQARNLSLAAEITSFVIYGYFKAFYQMNKEKY